MKSPLFLLLVCSLGLQAQSGTLAGTVRDPQGAVVPAARVTVRSGDNSAPKSTLTGSDGVYRVEGLGDGNLLLEVEAPGFRRHSKSLPAGGPGDVSLEIGGLNEAVVVTAEGAPQTIDQTSKAITLVDLDEINDRNEYVLAEIVRTTPGVQVRNLGGPGALSQIRVRGLRPDATAVLVDGMRFRDPSTTQADVSSFLSNLSFVSTGKVEVLRGSGSSLYGTQAVGGAINMVSDEGGGATHGMIQAEGGQLGFMRGRASVAGGWLKDRFTYSAGFTHINVLSGLDGNDRNRGTGGQVFARYDLTSKLKLTGRYYASDDFVQSNISPSSTGIPSANIPANGLVPAIPLDYGQVLRLNAGQSVDYGNATFIPGRDDPDNRRTSRFFTTLIGAQYLLSPKATVDVKWGRVYTNRFFWSGPAGAGFQPTTTNLTNPAGTIDTINTRVSYFAAPWYQITGGYEFEREEFRDDQNNFLTGNAALVVKGSTTQRSNAGFLQNQLSLLQNRLQISLSGRAQFFELGTPAYERLGTSNPYASVAGINPPRALTGDFSIAYFIPRTGTKLRGHAGNSYRAPALYERFGGGFSANQQTGAFNFTPYGDPRLGPDLYNSFDLGVDQYLMAQKIRIAATFFYTRTKRAILFDSSGRITAATDPFGRTQGYLPGAGAISRGLELGVETKVARNTTVTGSYTYTSAGTDRDISIAGYYRALTVPRHTATIVVRQQIKRADFSFDLFRGSTYVVGFFAAGRTRPFEFPGYTKADLVGGYKIWQTDKKTVRSYVKIENIFNQTYWENGWRTPGAWATVGLSYNF